MLVVLQEPGMRRRGRKKGVGRGTVKRGDGERERKRIGKEKVRDRKRRECKEWRSSMYHSVTTHDISGAGPPYYKKDKLIH